MLIMFNFEASVHTAGSEPGKVPSHKIEQCECIRSAEYLQVQKIIFHRKINKLKSSINVFFNFF